jgi:hypothetical protein
MMALILIFNILDVGISSKYLVKIYKVWFQIQLKCKLWRLQLAFFCFVFWGEVVASCRSMHSTGDALQAHQALSSSETRSDRPSPVSTRLGPQT